MIPIRCFRVVFVVVIAIERELLSAMDNIIQLGSKKLLDKCNWLYRPGDDEALGTR